ncbi:MAG: hypothetical protein WBA93_21585 [Microcoleaceae cyanobacterium]
MIDIQEAESQEDNKTETVLDKIKNKLSASTDNSVQRELFHTLVKQTLEKIPDVVKSLIEELGSDFDINITGVYYQKNYYRLIDWNILKFSTPHLIGINYKFVKKIFLPKF